MSAPPPPEGYGQYPAYGGDQAPETQGTPDPMATGAAAHAKKKKRGYAAGAFDVASGANAAGTPAAVPPSAVTPQFGMSQQQVPAYGAYPQQQQQPDPVAAAGYQPPGQVPQVGQPVAAPYGTYPPPDQVYPGVAPGVGGITQGMGGMNLGTAQPQAVPAQAQAAPRAVMNQLYPTDLVSQPFNAAELDLPPPPITLPPNSSVTPSPKANASPRYFRSTINAVPTSHSQLKKSKLPFALVLQPYGSLHDDEDDIPVIQDQVISRCRRCRTYINPYVTFLDHGHRWRCNMCNLSNDVPQAFDWDAATQQQADRWQRAELNHAIVEFVAPQEYMVRPPQPLVYLFLFDVSINAVSSGLLATAARTILDSLSRIPNADRRTRLGFLGVDSSLHYFSIPKDEDENAETSQLVVSDLDEPFLPVPHDLLINLSESRQSAERFLEKLPAMFQNSQSSQSCMGSALRAGHKLISGLGGKIVVLTASLPNIGVGKLEVREDKKLLGTAKEGPLLQTANSFYKSFAVECSKNQVSIDMFLFSQQYQDVASLSNLPRYTAGQTWFYPGWHASRPEDALKFASEFSDFLSSEVGLEAVLRVRGATGLRMNTFYGNFFNRSSDLCAFPSFPRDQCYVVEVAIDENMTKPVVCLQAAVLHTTCNGERRIRVMTLALPTTSNLSDLYSSADQVAITTYFSHKAVERALGSGLDAARDAVQSKATELLQVFKKELAGGSMGGGGLQFPANLRGLPLLFLSLTKNVGLRKSAQIPSDIRSAALCLLSTLPPPLLIRYIYPRLYSLHDMPDSAGLPDPETGHIVLPPPVNLSSERLAPYGLYLIDDGQTQFLWVGRDAVPQLLNDVFGVPDKSQLPVGKGRVPELEGDFNERVRAVVQKSRDHLALGVGSITVPHLYIVLEDGEPSLRIWAQTLLVEDRTDQSVSAAQWLSTLREKV
ncbi:protein transport protein SEC24 [Geosmithia morbida]|uniref:Protein transport protein SEC24 n=1 Tax=Geosmithia morbida TaxID=1094350 RepID=A0A9P5D390_9HYPO|nr:protein transport protein SEC24 [Geosmithia morbida]KAF4121550.1 protein transport protein SEC24 [Geosmithia morbida]